MDDRRPNYAPKISPQLHLVMDNKKIKQKADSKPTEKKAFIGLVQSTNDPTTVTPDPPRLHQAPIHSAEHLRMTLLCMNRLVGEPGLSRQIAGFYKDLLLDDIMGRMTVLRDSLWTSQSITPGTERQFQEALGYMQYYANNLMAVQYFFRWLYEIGFTGHLRPSIAATFLELALDQVQRYEADLLLPFVKLLAKILLPTNDEMNRKDDSIYTLEWRNNVVDKTLDAMNMIDKLADMPVRDTPSRSDACLLTALVFVNLSARPKSRHGALKRQFFTAVLTFDDTTEGEHEIVARGQG